MAEEEMKNREEQIRAKELFLKDARVKAKERGLTAVKHQQESDQKRFQEENFLKEKRAAVLKIENEFAHTLAQKHREKQQILDQMENQEQLLNEIKPGGTVVYGSIDYTKTHFHNPVILKHDIKGQNAIETAMTEQEKSLIRLQEKEDAYNHHQLKAVARGEEALLKVAVDKELAKLNKELEKIRKADGNCKIQKGIIDNVPQNRCIVKDTQGKIKKQAELEKMFEDIVGFNATDPEESVVQKGMYWETYTGPKNDSKNKVLAIPQPVPEVFIENETKYNDAGPSEKGLSKANDKFSTQKPGNVENESEIDDFHLSDSEEISEHEVLEAKYIPKPTKKLKPKSKPRHSSKKKKNLYKIQEKDESVLPSFQNNEFEIEETKEFKNELDNEYYKHLEIKKELENLKKFKYESNKNTVESNKSKKNSISSPGIHQVIEDVSQSIESDEESFKKTSNFPIPEEKDEEFDFYSKIKTELGSIIPESNKIPKKKEQNPYSDEEDSPQSESKNFLEEMKLKYGIVSKRDISPDPTPIKSTQKKVAISETEEIKDSSEQIFSERTLKLMKEIEEKYSLEKFKNIDDDDLRYAIPLSKPQKFEKEEEENYENSFRGKSQEQYVEDDISNKYSESQSEKEYSGIPDYDAFRGTNFKIEKKNETVLSDEEKASVDDNFFENIKHKYGININTKPQQKEFSYKFSFEDKFLESENKSQEIEDRSQDSQDKSQELEYNPQSSDNLDENGSIMQEYKNFKSDNSKKNGVVIDFTEDKGKSLAEIFKEKNKHLAENINKREAQVPKVTHKEKTKEELLEIRKDLLKSKIEKPEPQDHEKSNKKLENPLLERLGKGEKPKINKKEMHQLTKKNYEMLPEVQKKKEEERKKQEIKDRIKKSKEFEKVIFI